MRTWLMSGLVPVLYSKGVLLPGKAVRFWVQTACVSAFSQCESGSAKTRDKKEGSCFVHEYSHVQFSWVLVGVMGRTHVLRYLFLFA